MSSNKDAPPGSGQPRSSLDDEDLELDFGFEEPPPPRLNLGNKPELRRILSRLQEGTKPSKTRQERPLDPRRQERPLEMPATPAAPPMTLPLEPEEAEAEEPPLFYELRAKERPKLIIAGGVDEARAYMPPTKVQAPATRGKVMETLRVKIKETPEPAAPIDPRAAVTTRMKPGSGMPLDPRKAATVRMKPRDPADPRQAVTMRVAPPDPANPRQAATMKLPLRGPHDPRYAIGRRLDLRPLGQGPGDEYADGAEEVDLENEYEEIGPTQAPQRVPEEYMEAYPEEPAEEDPGPRIGVWLAVIAGAAILGGGIALLVRRSAMSDDPATAGAAASSRPAITAPQQPAGPSAAPSSATPKTPAPR
jgi:hypothetical protein